MSDTPLPSDGSPTSQLGGDLSAACDRFSRALEAGDRPRIEDFLRDVPAEQYDTLALRLLTVEIDYHLHNHETVDAAGLAKRFPQLANALGNLLNVSVKPRRLGKYELLHLLGRGGMGQVWKARHVNLGRIDAVKLIAEDSRDQLQVIKRFEREWQNLAKLRHPNIVMAYDAGPEQDTYMLAMEYVEGISLDQLIRPDQPLAIADVCGLISQAATGLQHAYEHGLIHRDIKPANLMLSKDGVVKILDFGLARVHVSELPEESAPLTEGFLGTLNYMAPEQFDNAREVDTRADTYSLGCTLFHLLCGEAPYSRVGGGPWSKEKAHCIAAIPRVADFRADADRRLCAIVERMLAKHPSDRYQTPGEVAGLLAGFATGANLRGLLATSTPDDRLENDTTHSPTRTRRQTAELTRPSEKTRRWRNRRLLVACGLLAVVALLGFMFSRPRNQAAEATRLMVALGTLPGLNGDWWFNENPRFIPPIRQAWLERLSQMANEGAASADGGIELPIGELLTLLGSSDTRAFDTRLGELCQSLPGKDADYYRKKCLNVDRGHTHPKDLGRKLQLVADDLAQRKSPPGLEAADLHLLAVVYHKLALNSKYGAQTADSGSLDAARDTAWSACEKAYEAAIARYKSDLGESVEVFHPKRFLLAACQTDVARMQFDRANYDSCEEIYANALGDLDNRAESPWFQTHTQCMLGAAFTRDGVWYDADTWLKEAETSARRLPANHPLRAFVLENRAWFLVKRGNRGRDAQEAFASANQLRRSLAAGDFRQNIFLFHNEHGQCMALHLTRDPELREQAKKDFVRLRQEIETELKRVKDAPDDFKFPPQYRLDLLERLVNAGEREADCYLFAPQPDSRRAAQLYTQAIRFAQSQGLDTSRLLSYVAQMQYSLVLALRLQEESDSPPAGEATSALSVADATYQTMPRTEQDQLVLVSLAAQATSDPQLERRLIAAKEIESLLRKKREASPHEIVEGKQDYSYLSRDERQQRDLLEQYREYLPTEAQNINLSP